MSSLWSRFSNTDKPAQSPVLLSDGATYFFFTPDGWIPLWESDQPQKFQKAIHFYNRDQIIAAANLIYVRDRFCELAGQSKATTSLPVSAFQQIVLAAIGPMILPEMSIEELESRRQTAISRLDPSMTMFLSSAIAESPIERADTHQAANYLGIALDISTRSMRRTGYHSPVLFTGKDKQWEIVCRLVAAGEQGLTADQRKNLDKFTSLEAWRQQKAPVNNSIAPLHLEIEAGPVWRLSDLKTEI